MMVDVVVVIVFVVVELCKIFVVEIEVGSEE